MWTSPQVTRTALALALLVLVTADSRVESECDCEAMKSSLSCFSEEWESLNCSILNTEGCSGNLNLTYSSVLDKFRMSEVDGDSAKKRFFYKDVIFSKKDGAFDLQVKYNHDIFRK